MLLKNDMMLQSATTGRCQIRYSNECDPPPQMYSFDLAISAILENMPHPKRVTTSWALKWLALLKRKEWVACDRPILPKKHDLVSLLDCLFPTLNLIPRNFENFNAVHYKNSPK